MKTLRGLSVREEKNQERDVQSPRRGLRERKKESSHEKDASEEMERKTRVFVDYFVQGERCLREEEVERGRKKSALSGTSDVMDLLQKKERRRQKKGGMKRTRETEIAGFKLQKDSALSSWRSHSTASLPSCHPREGKSF